MSEQERRVKRPTASELTEEQERKVKLVVASAVIVLAIMIIALLANIISAAVLKSRETRLKAELSSLTTQNEHIQNEVDKYNTDAYAEQYARDYLNMIKPGEKVLITE